VGDSIRESAGFGLWEESLYKGDWITIVRATNLLPYTSGD